MTEGQNAYRWFSSLLLYNDFVQLGSNLLLFLALGVHLERRFGTRRLLLLTMIAGVGGNFFSAAFEVISSLTHQAASMLSCLSCIKCNSRSCSPPHQKHEACSAGAAFAYGSNSYISSAYASECAWPQCSLAGVRVIPRDLAEPQADETVPHLCNWRYIAMSCFQSPGFQPCPWLPCGQAALLASVSAWHQLRSCTGCITCCCCSCLGLIFRV